MANPEHLAILKEGTDTFNRWREANRNIIPDLGEPYLVEPYLVELDRGEPDFIGADLSAANLRRADLSWALLDDANLRWANLREANLNVAHLAGAKLHAAMVRWTAFASVNLSKVDGLKTMRHRGPSTIGIDTIYKSKGLIPEVFLQGCGVPDTFIEYAASLVRQPIEYYSCFIGYSSDDREFAERLTPIFRTRA